MFNPFWWLEFNAALFYHYTRRLKNDISMLRWDSHPKAQVLEFRGK
jgi:hypothetical protein